MRVTFAPRLFVVLALAAACGDDRPRVRDGGPGDAGSADDAAPAADAVPAADAGADAAPTEAGMDARAPTDGARPPEGGTDAGASDGAGPDMDAGRPRDAGAEDAGADMDAGAGDAGGAADGGPPAGLSTPCENGPGWTLIRFHYESSAGTSPRIDVWDATCTYSLAPGSACNVTHVGSVESVMSGYAVELSGSDSIRARFSVDGLTFSQSTFYVQARSYDTTSSTYYDVWSPLYGGVEGGPVDNDFTYNWYEVDWSDYLYPSDDPDLTAFELSDGRGSGSLAVHAVELCVR